MPQHDYASLNRRVLASVFDLFLITLILAPTLILLYGAEILISPYLFEGIASVLLITLVAPGTLLAFWYYFGATPGKLILGIRIVTLNTGTALSLKQCLIRLTGFFFLVVTFGISYLIMLRDSRRQTIHDKLSNSAVVNIRSKSKADKTGLPAKAFNFISLTFSSLLIVWFASLGFINLLLIPGGAMPTKKLYTDASVSEYARQSLHRNKILHEDRYILLFHPTGFYFSSSGSILTSDRIVTYWRSHDGIQIDQALYTEIIKVELIQNEALFESSVLLISTNETTLQINASAYDNYDKKMLSTLKTAIERTKIRSTISPQ